jgi:hypothetical protein
MSSDPTQAANIAANISAPGWSDEDEAEVEEAPEERGFVFRALFWLFDYCWEIVQKIRNSQRNPPRLWNRFYNINESIFYFILLDAQSDKCGLVKRSDSHER